MNNKGFAISTMLYGLIIIIALVMAMILSTMAFNRKASREFSSMIQDELENKDKLGNPYVYNAYTYNTSTCVTGNEPSCIKTTCYKKGNTCPDGTIIDYKVNDNDIVRFHVLFDYNDRIVMQSQKNVVYNEIWGSTSGPTYILYVLENATNQWTNVNDLIYAPGGTDFTPLQSKWTSCREYNSCSSNSYTLGMRSAKARLIRVQELAAFGCSRTTNRNCPKWAFNYLKSSTNNGGTENDTSVANNNGYWTMNTNEVGRYAWYMATDGYLDYAIGNVEHATFGARAVVEISK